MELKYLTEKRAENQEEMQKILSTAKLEKRALTEEEISKFNELKKLIMEIDATINAEEEAREMDLEKKKKENEVELTTWEWYRSFTTNHLISYFLNLTINHN